VRGGREGTYGTRGPAKPREAQEYRARRRLPVAAPFAAAYFPRKERVLVLPSKAIRDAATCPPEVLARRADYAPAVTVVACELQGRRRRPSQVVLRSSLRELLRMTARDGHLLVKVAVRL